MRALNDSLEAQVVERTAFAEDRALLAEQVSEALRVTSDELRRSNDELNSFVYSVSHDLKEPLRTLEAFSQFLMMEYGSSVGDVGKDYLTRLTLASSRMKTLIDAVLTISRIGRSSEGTKEIDTRRAVSAVVLGMRAAGHLRGVQLDVAADLPRVLADDRRVDQIFAALISNAVKFNRAGTPHVTVGASVTDTGETVFFVRDNGVGIDPEYHDRIFGIFQRLHLREEFEGTGAGLTIVKRAVESLGGRIWVESALGAGATFYFTLPAPIEAAGQPTY